ncbi:MAG: TIGR00266 family protein [Armatimonadetes bacterium]|nr:TIGR00266 family protein [Candidatus Hippobium faecium]
MTYEIIGGNMPAVECTLFAGECMMTEKGSMCWMSGNMKMDTKMPGGIGGVFGRMFTGESAFRNYYTPNGNFGKVAFASSFPGKIIPINIGPGNEIIAQKTAFLAAEATVQTSVFFNKKLRGGFFGGEGFIMQKISGNGMAFLEIDGDVKEVRLSAGEEILIDTGYLAAMSTTCKMDIKALSGFRNIFFGGEGLFLTKINGPGTVYLQTMPISNLALLMYSMMPKTNN